VSHVHITRATEVKRLSEAYRSILELEAEGCWFMASLLRRLVASGLEALNRQGPESYDLEPSRRASMESHCETFSHHTRPNLRYRRPA
jgi:hypothetical protein